MPLAGNAPNLNPNCTRNTEAPKGIPEAFVPREIDRAPEPSVPADQDILNLEPEPAGRPS